MFGDLLSTAGYTTRRSGRPSRKRDGHPKLLTMVLSSYHSSVVKVPHFPRETKNRCKLPSFASAQVQARSLGCTVCPAHGGLNDLLADYTQAGIPVKGNGEFESTLQVRVAVEREAESVERGAWSVGWSSRL